MVRPTFDDLRKEQRDFIGPPQATSATKVAEVNFG